MRNGCRRIFLACGNASLTGIRLGSALAEDAGVERDTPVSASLPSDSSDLFDPTDSTDVTEKISRLSGKCEMEML